MNDAWPRLEAGDKVTGVARFEGDLPEPGMLHAALVTSPSPAARFWASIWRKRGRPRLRRGADP